MTDTKQMIHVKVNGPCVQTFYIEKDSHMDAIKRANTLK